jgi:hypothetical protein
MFAGIALVMLGNYYVYDSIGPIAESLSRDLHFTDTQIGTLNAIYSLPNIFLVGPAERAPRTPVATPACFGFSVF